MIISMCSPVFDLDGHLVVSALADSEMDDITRRVNRVATLDGGASANDAGYSAADRVFRVRWAVRSSVELETAKRFVRLYTRVILSNREGVFSAIPEGVSFRDGIADLNLFVMEQLA